LLGTSLICDFAGRKHREENDPFLGMDANSFPGVNRRLVWQDRYSWVSCASYEHYPVFVCEDGDFLAHLEGRVYNVDESRLSDELLGLSRLIFSQETEPASRLSRWLLGADGDFLLVLINKADGRMAVLNDVFARLPTYFHLRDNFLILSRNLKYITIALGEATFDPLALAQYLLLGFSLGKKSLFAGIDYLEPASLIFVSPKDASVKVSKLHEFNFEAEEQGRRSSTENARNLAGLFREACRKRAGGAGENVVSLSGGLDSRAVAAGLRGEGIPLTTASFLDHRRSNTADFETAARVAQSLGVEWRGFHLRPPQGKDLLELLTIKGGLNNLGMSFILPFFRQLRESCGDRLTYFTGDGGSDAVGISYPHRQVDTPEAMVKYIIDKNRIFTLEEVAALTRLHPRDILGETTADLTSYPETSVARKYKHFFAVGSPTRVYHEGEDRNRHFFWSVSPFYAYDFFHYAMNCPDRDKKAYRLYLEFLRQLHPAVGGVDYADWQAPLASRKFFLLYGVKSLTRRRPNFIRHLRGLFKLYDSVDAASNVLACLEDQQDTCAPISHYLDSRFLARVFRKPQDFDRNQIWTLITITSTIAYYSCPSAVGDDFLDRDFV
jgi:asparagine synthase (glutamine-hydrolysing)